MKDGKPISWRHFQYGLSYLQRLRVRTELSMHNAVVMTKAKDSDRKTYENELRMLAGY